MGGSRVKGETRLLFLRRVFAPEVEAFAFLVTPSQGAKLAEWESRLSLNPQLDEMAREGL